MAEYLVTSSAPLTYSLGFKDESRVPQLPESISRPQFNPHFFILAPRSYDNAMEIKGNALNAFGEKAFEMDSPFYTHQNAFLKKLISKANQCSVETIRLPGSNKAIFRLSVELISTKMDRYERVADPAFGTVGTFALDNVGARNVIGEVNGSKLALHVGRSNYTADQSAFGKAVIKQCRAAGAEVSGQKISQLGTADSAATYLYPIMDIELSWYGKEGDLSGLRIYSPTTQDDNGPNVADIRRNKALTYRFVTVNKETETSLPQLSFLLSGDVAFDATFKKESVSNLSKDPISIDRSIVQAYSKRATPAESATIGPWGRVKIYDAELEQLTTMLANGYSVTAGTTTYDIAGEGDYDTDPTIGPARESWAQLSDPANNHLINFLTGRDHNGIPYETINVDESVALGGVTFDGGVAHFAEGGGDGLYYYADGRPAADVNAKLFDDAVRARLNQFGLGVNKYKDALRHPISTIIDSGFSLKTKLAMPQILRIRPDMWIISAAHAVYDEDQVMNPNARSIYRDGDLTDTSNVSNLVDTWGLCGQQTEAEEEAYAEALRSRYNLMPESDYFSTPVTRAVIYAHSGTVIESGIWDGYLPLTYEFMCQCSDLAGDASGKWRRGYDFNRNPNNIIKMMDNINNTYRENSKYISAWSKGLTFAKHFDIFRSYIPATQTVYPYEDSVLNGTKTMMACSYLEWLNIVLHSEFVGRDDLTDNEFIHETRRRGDEMVDDIFGGQYIVETHPEITDADKAKGWIWRNFFHLYANKAKTALIYGVIARNASDYAPEA